MTNKEFMDKFKVTKFFEDIYNNPHVLGMFIAGSRLIGYNNEDSDFDLVVLIDDAENKTSFSSTIYYSFEGIDIHTYFINFPYIINEEDTTGIIFGLFKHYYLELEDIFFMRSLKALVKIRDKKTYEKLYKKYQDIFDKARASDNKKFKLWLYPVDAVLAGKDKETLKKEMIALRKELEL